MVQFASVFSVFKILCLWKKVHSAVHQINHYPMDNIIGSLSLWMHMVIYPVDSWKVIIGGWFIYRCICCGSILSLVKILFPFVSGMVLCMIMSLKQREIKFEPRIKLNHNICGQLVFNQCITLLFTFFPLSLATWRASSLASQRTSHQGSHI